MIAVHAPERVELNVFPISAGLVPAGSQLVSYNQSSEMVRSPSGLPRWKQRLICYPAETRNRIELQSLLREVNLGRLFRFLLECLELIERVNRFLFSEATAAVLIVFGSDQR